jgi:hypothetical protein
MMKIGILTFHHSNNYGAVLQCFGLQQALKKLGTEVEVLDYIPPEAEPMPFWRGWNIRGGDIKNSFKKRFLQLRHRKAAMQAFEAFRKKHLILSSKCSSNEEVAQVVREYDAVVSGSDQVWVFDRPSPYFLEWGVEYPGRRISYAACCGHDRQRLDKADNVKQWLSAINSISVRNDFSKKIISCLTEKPIVVGADPTLLINYDSLQKKRELPFAEYILVYTLSGDRSRGHGAIISAIKEKVGDLPVVSVVTNSCPASSPLSDLELHDCSPQEWLWLIANARFVYTDSFHGVLFAVKYHREFIADYSEEWRALRLLDVARRYGLANRVAHGVDDAVGKILRGSEVDYAVTDVKIAQHVALSITFLREALAI